jgi:branched-chain amino acid transport system substrate-binding protein
MLIRRLIGVMFVFSLAVFSFAACSSSGNDDDSTSEYDDHTVSIAGQQDDSADDEAGGDDSAKSTVRVGESGADIEIGVVLSLSGPNAAYGDPSLRGIELAIADFNETAGSDGPVFAATVLDDEGDAQLGSERFAEHVARNVDVILGPTLSNTAFEAHPVAQEAGVPVLAISNTAAGITDTGDFIFRVSLAEDGVVPQTVNVISSAWQPETAALVYSEDDAWSRSSADAFRHAVTEHGIEIITEQTVASDGGDFSAQIDEIESADPDVILLSALERPSIEFVRQARELGLEQNIACGNGCNTGTFIAETGEAAEGLVVGSAWHIDVDNELSAAFVDRYQELHGVEPDQFSAQAYAGMQLLRAAIDASDEISPSALRDALDGLGEVETVLGPFVFDGDRDGIHPAVIKVVQGGSFSILGK